MQTLGSQTLTLKLLVSAYIYKPSKFPKKSTQKVWNGSLVGGFLSHLLCYYGVKCMPYSIETQNRYLLFFGWTKNDDVQYHIIPSCICCVINIRKNDAGSFWHKKHSNCLLVGTNCWRVLILIFWWVFPRDQWPKPLLFDVYKRLIILPS